MARFNPNCTCSDTELIRGDPAQWSVTGNGTRESWGSSRVGQAYAASKGPNRASRAQGILLAYSSQGWLLDKNRLLTLLISSIIRTLEEKKKKRINSRKLNSENQQTHEGKVMLKLLDSCSVTAHHTGLRPATSWTHRADALPSVSSSPSR